MQRWGMGIVALLLAVAAEAVAYDGPVEKKVFTLPTYTTVGGQTIKQVRVGYETYGTLAPTRDNVILITHFFSGTSHAAGRYRPTDPAPGYWDAIIGAGKPVDTDRFFVVSSDTLVNLNVKDPNTVTTGPASINPDTGRPYGMRFPIVTIRDFVNVQKALLDALGVRRLRAVMGASMGALQAFEWAAAYPEMVERIVPVIGAAEVDAYTIGWLHLWGAPIRLDPRWNGGDYYGRDEPVDGLTLALKLVTLHARHWVWADRTYGRRWAKPDRDPGKAWEHQFAIEAGLESLAAARARVADANSFLYLVRANQLFVTGHRSTLEEGLKRVKAPVLLLPASSDLLLVPEHSRRVRALLAAQGTPVEYIEIEGDGGHLDGILAIAKVGDAIRRFLGR